MDEKTFRDLEHQGWLEKAEAYRDMWGTITEQAITPILATFGDLSGKRLLDVGSGTGELTAEAAGRGATAEGLDFAATMVAKASQKYPRIPFREGDAEKLPYPDGRFDAAVCSFGLLHMADADCALQEARRVLKAGGRYTFTAWCGPEQGGDFFKLVMGAIREHGTLDVPLPPAPPIFRFADTGERVGALSQAGFAAPETASLQLGRVHTNAQSIGDECEVDESHEHDIELLEPREDPAKAFESAEQPLDLIAPLVHGSVVFPRRDAILLGRNDRNKAQIKCQLPRLVALVCPVHQQVQRPGRLAELA